MNLEKLAWWNKVNWDFLYSRQWAIFINVVRVLTFIGIFLIFYLLYTEIESVKLLSSACEICSNKTGAQCFVP